MTSLPSDGVELEQRTQPVPSSEKMALEVGVNGHAHHDDRRDALESAAPADDVARDTDVSAALNSEAIESNMKVNVDPSESLAALTSEDNGKMGAALSKEALPDLAVAGSDEPSLSTQTNNASNPPHSENLEQELEKQTTELPPTTTDVPPVVEAVESDVRDEAPTTTEAPATEVKIEEVKTEAADMDQSNDLFGEGMTDGVPTTTTAALEEQPADVSTIDLNKPSQTSTQEDVDMLDTPKSPAKITHPRDEDTADEPAAKRAKTDEMEVDQPATIPAAAPATTNGGVPSAPGDEIAPTTYQQKELLKVLKSVKSTLGGKNFARAVVEMWPTLKDSYLDKVSHPMDLTTMEHKLKAGYPSLGAFKADVQLIYTNCVAFNGTEHTVTAAAKVVRDSIMSRIPPAEPVKVDKKRKATPILDAKPREAPARRPSRGAANASSPVQATSAQTFALDPSGTPLIRRDSTKDDGGRPKREIHPPKPKDLPYNARPKKKKFATELKFCDDVLTELQKPKYAAYNAPFMVPVDPVALGIPEYFKIIKSPMDLSTVRNKLNTGQYENSKEFEADVRLIFKNCYKFNPVGSPVNVMGHKLEDIFEAEWSKKAQYIADHTSSPNAASPVSYAESEDEESEEEEEPEQVEDSSAAIAKRLIDEQNKLIEIMSAKKRDEAMISMQQSVIDIIKKQLDDIQKQKSKPKKAAKPSKKSSASSKPSAGKKDVKKTGGYRPKHIGMTEKEQISAGIVQLDGKMLDQAVAYLKMDFPDLSLDDETELDIDQFSNTTLSRLHDLIIKHVPGVVPAKPEPARGGGHHKASASGGSKPKKNKPMSKVEQEQKIETLKKLKREFDGVGSGDERAAGRHVVQSVEQDPQSSGDEESSDSEED